MSSSPTTLRRFNRAWSQRVGILQESFLGSGRALGPSRLLFEIGPDGADLHSLRRRLELDSGYLSRLLRQLEDEDLVTLSPDPDDRRRRRATLTPAGRRAWDRLEQRSEDLARELVAPLTDRQRARLDDALATAELLIRAATVRFEEAPADSAEAVRAVTAYVAELDSRFPEGFAPGAALTADAHALAPPHGAFVLARSAGDVVACGGVQRLDPRTAEIKRMWVHPDWRGAGLGARTLEHLERLAADRGHRVVRLDTNGTLAEAVAMYRRSGYREIGRYNDNPYAEAFFEKDLA